MEILQLISMKKNPVIILVTFFSLLHGSSSAQSGSSAQADPIVTDRIPAQLKARVSAASPDSMTLAQAFLFTDSLFNRAGFTYDIAEPDIPKDIQAILARFSNAVSADKEWFADYRKKYAVDGRPLPYNERFGITPGEYLHIQQFGKLPLRLVPVSQQKVTISRESNTIHFKSDGEALILNYLEIDLQKQKIIFAGDTLPFTGGMDAAQLSRFHLTKGYVWRLEKADLKSTLQTDKITASVMEFDLGLPAETGRAFLHILYQDLQSGVTRADMDLTGFVH
jgi:hypothetical protein